jgi:uncharacterized membrane protein YhfC
MAGTVSNSSIAAMFVTLFISMVLPIIVLIVYALKNRRQGVASAWFIGAAGFFVTQMVIRVPLLSALSSMPGFVAFAENQYVLYALMLGLTAALFEAAGRYASAKILSKNLTFTKGFAAGLGHGGIEAIVLIGMTYVSNLLYVAMINTGAIEGVIAQTEAMGVDGSSEVYALVDTLVNGPAYLYLLAGYERILAMIGHVAMTLVVFYFISKEETLKGIGICVLYHFVMDSMVGIIGGLATPYLGSVISQNVSYAITYVFLTVMAAIAVVAIAKIRVAFQE